MGDRPVFVGVPVWRGAAFVAETLRSILAQDGVALRVLVAIDGEDVGSLEACQPFVTDSRVKIVRHPQRLGWVGNIAFLFGEGAKEGAEYVCVQPHDDLIEPGYLAALLDQAQRSPRAAVVYSDIGIIGDGQRGFRIPSVVGTPLQRQMAMLRHHYSAAAIRGLTRVSALRLVPPISGNPVGDFAADTVWCARLATAGDLVRVPEMLYRKRYHAQNTHSKWNRWGRDRKVAAWKQHCLDMLAEALPVARDGQQAELLLRTAATRLMSGGPAGSPCQAEIARLGPQARRQLAAEFATEAAKLGASVVPRVGLGATGLLSAPALAS